MSSSHKYWIECRFPSGWKGFRGYPTLKEARELVDSRQEHWRITDNSGKVVFDNRKGK